MPHWSTDGLVQVAALWPLVCWTKDREADGEILDGYNPVSPSVDPPFEVRVFNIQDGVVGADHTGTEPGREVWAWCAEQAQAVVLAEAAVAHSMEKPC